MQPRKLYRTEGPYAKVFGVCGGLGEYFGVDPTILRVILVVLVLCGTVGLWPYLIAALIIPKKSTVYPGY